MESSMVQSAKVSWAYQYHKSDGDSLRIIIHLESVAIKQRWNKEDEQRRM